MLYFEMIGQRVGRMTILITKLIIDRGEYENIKLKKPLISCRKLEEKTKKSKITQKVNTFQNMNCQTPFFDYQVTVLWGTVKMIPFRKYDHAVRQTL